MKPWLSKQWCIPPKANAEFVWRMEDILEVYKRPYDPRRPVVCLDETSKQLIGEVATPVPVAPGHVAQYDYEYVRNGVANVFMMSEPLAGRREVEITARRTKKDWARCLWRLSEVVYAVTLITGGLFALDAHMSVAVLLIASAAAAVVSFAIIEPATAKGAKL